MNIIFLDIDGVLNSLPYFESVKGLTQGKYNEISDFHLEKLSEIYHTCDAHIVLSSTWRELDVPSDMNCNPMYEYLLKSLKKYNMKLMSKTPVINMNRPLEIATWLDNRTDKEDINFVSLDDQKYGIADKLVRTKFFCKNISDGGLQQTHVDKVIKILNRKRR